MITFYLKIKKENFEIKLIFNLSDGVHKVVILNLYMMMLLGSQVKGELLVNFIGQDYYIHGNN